MKNKEIIKEIKMDFFNNNYKKFLVAGDKVLYHTKQENNSYKYLRSTIMAFFLTIWVMLLSSAIIISIIKALKISPLFFLFFALLIFTIQMIVVNMIYISKHFLITENGIYKISGLLNKQVKFIPYTKITDTSLTIGFIQNFYDIGTINISTAGGTTRNTYSPYEASITNIKNFKKVNDMIMSKLKK